MRALTSLVLPMISHSLGNEVLVELSSTTSTIMLVRYHLLSGDQKNESNDFQPPIGSDWNIYGFGTPAYRKVLKRYLQTHKYHGLVVDYSMGPTSGQGVPAKPDEIGLSWEMVCSDLQTPETS